MDKGIKRVLDVLVATTLLLLTLPVLALALVGSAITLRAWPFFMQERVGLDGQKFRFLKIRTLPPTTPAYADKYQLVSVRIPRFTQALRRLHLDELPQLLLVLIGRMSLVGPRPELPNLHERLDPAFARLRTSVRPGCTGPWQVSDKRGGLIGEAPEYDSYYVQHQSLRLDARVLAHTAKQMLGFGQPLRLDALEEGVAVIDLPTLERLEVDASLTQAS